MNTTTVVYPLTKSKDRWGGSEVCIVGPDGKLALPNSVALKININAPLFLRVGRDWCIEIWETLPRGEDGQDFTRLPIGRVLEGRKPNEYWLFYVEIPKRFLPVKSSRLRVPLYPPSYSFWYANEKNEFRVVLIGEDTPFLKLWPWPWDEPLP